MQTLSYFDLLEMCSGTTQQPLTTAPLVGDCGVHAKGGHGGNRYVLAVSAVSDPSSWQGLPAINMQAGRLHGC